jgi:hypothetical protein
MCVFSFPARKCSIKSFSCATLYFDRHVTKMLADNSFTAYGTIANKVVIAHIFTNTQIYASIRGIVLCINITSYPHDPRILIIQMGYLVTRLQDSGYTHIQWYPAFLPLEYVNIQHLAQYPLSPDQVYRCQNIHVT